MMHDVACSVAATANDASRGPGLKSRVVHEGSGAVTASAAHDVGSSTAGVASDARRRVPELMQRVTHAMSGGRPFTELHKLLAPDGGGHSEGQWQGTRRNQRQETTFSAQFVPGMRFLVCEFGRRSVWLRCAMLVLLEGGKMSVSVLSLVGSSQNPRPDLAQPQTAADHSGPASTGWLGALSYPLPSPGFPERAWELCVEVRGGEERERLTSGGCGRSGERRRSSGEVKQPAQSELS
eukprot:3742456-Rhodomonas_salina.1